MPPKIPVWWCHPPSVLVDTARTAQESWRSSRTLCLPQALSGHGQAVAIPLEGRGQVDIHGADSSEGPLAVGAELLLGDSHTLSSPEDSSLVVPLDAPPCHVTYVRHFLD